VTIVRPRTLDEAIAALGRHPDAHLLHGGTDLMVEVNFAKMRPVDVVSLRRITELRRWHVDESTHEIVLGAGVRWTDLEREPLRSLSPALAQAARTVGSPQIRAAGTIGGNLGTCSPAGDGLPVLSALDATVVLRGGDGQREVSFHDFMTGPKRSVRKAGEIIVAVRWQPTGGFEGYAKIGVRNAMVISVASVCLVHDSRAGEVRVALGAVGPTIIRARAAEAWLRTRCDLHDLTAVSDDLSREFGDRVRAEANAIDDHRSTRNYRHHGIGVLATRLLDRARKAAT
jgi:CO/xanthine dehydrogenase FAD-binding subunit